MMNKILGKINISEKNISLNVKESYSLYYHIYYVEQKLEAVTFYIK